MDIVKPLWKSTRPKQAPPQHVPRTYAEAHTKELEEILKVDSSSDEAHPKKKQCTQSMASDIDELPTPTLSAAQCLTLDGVLEDVKEFAILKAPKSKTEPTLNIKKLTMEGVDKPGRDGKMKK
jgi:hypothetical protein